MKERGILFSAPMVRALLDGSKTQTRRPMKWQPEPDSSVTVGTYHPTVIDRNDEEQPGPERFGAFDHEGEWGQPCPYGRPGDRLWVREAWRASSAHDPLAPRDIPVGDGIEYGADQERVLTGKLRPSLFMPRWASRITLEITGVRVQRLMDITEVDAVAEGCKASPFPGPMWQGYRRLEGGKLLHTQTIGETAPDWMVEPHAMGPNPHLDRSARDAYRLLWIQINGIESWDDDPWVWVVEFKRIES